MSTSGGLFLLFLILEGGPLFIFAICRCSKNIYVSSFFPSTARLSYSMLSFDLKGVASRDRGAYNVLDQQGPYDTWKCGDKVLFQVDKKNWSFKNLILFNCMVKKYSLNWLQKSVNTIMVSIYGPSLWTSSITFKFRRLIKIGSNWKLSIDILT